MLNEDDLADLIAPGSDEDSDEEEEEEQALRKELRNTTDKKKRTELKRKIKAIIKERKRREKAKRAELRKKYKALLEGGDSKPDDVHMEVTFKPQLGDALEKKLKEKKEQENETVFEAQMRREKEKRRERRLAKKAEDMKVCGYYSARDLPSLVIQPCRTMLASSSVHRRRVGKPTLTVRRKTMKVRWRFCGVRNVCFGLISVILHSDMDPSLRRMMEEERGGEVAGDEEESGSEREEGKDADADELALLTMPDDVRSQW